MNVMLNIAVETGADRAGASTRRAGGETQAGEFGALFDEVAKPGAVNRQSAGRCSR